MKKYTKIIVAFTITLIMIVCIIFGYKLFTNEKVPSQPQVSEMKSICELATLKCYFNNVAKYSEEDVEGILFWKKDANFWVEYNGVVTLGIDASLVDMSINGTKVTIALPKAKVLSSNVDELSLNEDSYVFEEGSASISAEKQREAFEHAQKTMKQTASSDVSLLLSAQQRAQILLEEYIKNIGDAVNIQYEIEWKYLETDGTPDDTEE